MFNSNNGGMRQQKQVFNTYPSAASNFGLSGNAHPGGGKMEVSHNINDKLSVQGTYEHTHGAGNAFGVGFTYKL